MAKLTIVNKRLSSFKGQDGETISGAFYLAFTPSKGIEFWSSNVEHSVFPDELEFNAEKCEEINLRMKMGAKGIKYSEVSGD